MSHIYDYTWEISDSDTARDDVFKDSLILGTGIGQEYYLKKPRKIRHIKVDKDGKESYTEEEIFEYDDCILEPVRLQDFFIDENARNINSGPYPARDCIRRYVMDIDDFKNFFTGKVWDPLENAKRVIPGKGADYYEFYKPPTGIDHSRQVEVLWYWSRVPKDYLVVIANDVVIRMGPNIYRHKQLPFARAIDIKRTHRFYGKGEPELLESVQNEKDTLRRMILDRNHLDIDKMFLVGSRNQLSEEDLIARPHAMVPVDDPDSVKAVEYGDIPRSVEMSLKALDEDGTIATGIDPRFTSAPQAGTATEAAILKESALRRLRMKIRMFQRGFLVDVARLRVANIIQFYSQPRLEKIVGEKGSQDFEKKIEELKAKGVLEEMGGDFYQKSYKNIKVKDKKLDFDERGQVKEVPYKGYTFFEAKPEFFIPAVRGGFDIKFSAGPTLPPSIPLMQSKTVELYDRLIQNPGFDPIKLGDLLLTVHDRDPDALHAQPAEGEDTESGGLQMQIELAMRENQMLTQGQEVPPTEYASPAHSRIHIEFMGSDQVPSDPQILQNFSNHVMPELMAQAHRGGQGGAMGAEGGMGGGMGNEGNSPMQAIQGGESARKA